MLDLDPLLNLVSNKISKDPSHDILHIKRVMKMCTQLSRGTDANPRILLPAACLHDLVNIPKNHPDRAQASQESAREASQILETLDFTLSEIQKISKVIAEHSYSAGKSPSSLESAILQDADRLDALGAIGIMRTITCGCFIGSTYYHPENLLGKDRTWDDKKYALDHFFIKLFKIPEILNTEAAKKEADKRIQFMETFLQQLGREI